MNKQILAAFYVLMLSILPAGLAADTTPNPVHIDFSLAGYEAGTQPLPMVSAVISLKPSGRDDTDLLQSAIDHVSALPLDAHGFRGAIFLRPGLYHVGGQIRIATSGIVLRGSGNAATTLLADGQSRRTLILIGGTGDPTLEEPVSITDDVVAAGSHTLTLASVS